MLCVLWQKDLAAASILRKVACFSKLIIVGRMNRYPSNYIVLLISVQSTEDEVDVQSEAFIPICLNFRSIINAPPGNEITNMKERVYNISGKVGNDKKMTVFRVLVSLLQIFVINRSQTQPFQNPLKMLFCHQFSKCVYIGLLLEQCYCCLPHNRNNKPYHHHGSSLIESLIIDAGQLLAYGAFQSIALVHRGEGIFEGHVFCRRSRIPTLELDRSSISGLEFCSLPSFASPLVIFPQYWHLLDNWHHISTLLARQLLYDKFCRLLSEELYHRKARGTPFTEPQLWQLLLTLVKCEKQLEIFGQALGDVRPQNIFLNQFRKIRVGGRNSWPAGSSAFEKGVQRISAFVSPQDMEALSSGAMKPCDTMTSDIFAIGLTLLSLANLANYESIYKMGEKKMDLETLSQGIVTVKRNKSYSEIIRCIIVNLCSHDPKERMDLEQLWGLLSKHESKIWSKHSFVIDNAPKKLHSQVEKLRAFIADNPMLFASEQLLSEVGGSGLEFPAHLDVHKIKPEYVFSETKTIIEHLQ